MSTGPDSDIAGWGAVRARLKAALVNPGGGVIWLAYLLDMLALFVLIASGWILVSVLLFVAARFASRKPTMIGWGFLAALVSFILVPMLFQLFNPS